MIVAGYALFAVGYALACVDGPSWLWVPLVAAAVAVAMWEGRGHA